MGTGELVGTEREIGGDQGEIHDIVGGDCGEIIMWGSGELVGTEAKIGGDQLRGELVGIERIRCEPDM